jgi:hypothetical protein
MTKRRIIFFFLQMVGIEVTANDSKDSENIQSALSHLTDIVSMFSAGDFSVPSFVHSRVPPGATTMKEKRSQITYSFEELPGGGRVRIKTTDSDSLKAIYEFLRFQVDDHHTDDTKEINRP